MQLKLRGEEIPDTPDILSRKFPILLAWKSQPRINARGQLVVLDMIRNRVFVLN